MNYAPIVEIFETIQGEGINTGKPSVFVRLWGCNLRCRFDGVECDTPYAVYTEKDKALQMHYQDVAKRIQSLKPKHVVWTGGEPMMFQLFITNCIQTLNTSSKYTHEIETNGTIVLNYNTKNWIDFFNLSIKLKSSNQIKEYEDKRIVRLAIESYPFPKSIFKFVVMGEEDMYEINYLHKHFPFFKVYLMPQGRTREDVIKNSEIVVKNCIEYNYTYSPRLHIMLWDMKRGV